MDSSTSTIAQHRGTASSCVVSPACLLAGGVYPVDYGAAEGSLFSSASDCMAVLGSDCLYGQTCFLPPQASKVEVAQSNMVWLQLFEDQACFLPALHDSKDAAQVVALHLHGRWWAVDDVLKTSRNRIGLMLVQSEVERVILFLLSQRVGEKLPGKETVFSPHPRTEMSKILWLNKEAVGFYTVKQKGSLCDGCTSQSYVLPVLDTVLVRAHARRRGLGLQMLEDFCSSFPNEVTLGVSAPISDTMAAVCRKYLQLHPRQKERLYEVTPPGGWGQRRNIWLNIQLQQCALDHKRAGDEVSRRRREGEEERRRRGEGEEANRGRGGGKEERRQTEGEEANRGRGGGEGEEANRGRGGEEKEKRQTEGKEANRDRSRSGGKQGEEERRRGGKQKERRRRGGKQEEEEKQKQTEGEEERKRGGKQRERRKTQM